MYMTVDPPGRNSFCFQINRFIISSRCSETIFNNYNFIFLDNYGHVFFGFIGNTIDQTPAPDISFLSRKVNNKQQSQEKKEIFSHNDSVNWIKIKKTNPIGMGSICLLIGSS